MRLPVAPAQLWGWGRACSCELSRCVPRCELTYLLLVPPDVHKCKPPGSPGVLRHPCAVRCVPSCDPRDPSSCDPSRPDVCLSAHASPRPPNPPRCEHPGEPWCPRCARKSSPPQLCPKSPPDVNLLRGSFAPPRCAKARFTCCCCCCASRREAPSPAHPAHRPPDVQADVSPPLARSAPHSSLLPD